MTAEGIAGGARAALLILAPLSAFAVAASLAPLAVYTLALGAFGLPHVLSELRYVDRRFGQSPPRGYVLVCGALLFAIVTTRACVVAHVLTPEVGAPIELSCAALLALVCANGPPLRKTLALFIGGAIGAAAWVAPFATLVAFSILHNFTPLGFLWQISPSQVRRRVMTLASLAFFALPLAVALGLPRAIFGEALSGLDPLDAGPLAAHLGVYVPQGLLGGGHTRDLFAASVTAQGAHYLCVLVLLPALLRRLEPGAKGLFAWPKAQIFVALCVAAGMIALLGFARDFVEARALYGIVASFHAWIEIPILIVALTADRPSSRAPRTESIEVEAPTHGAFHPPIMTGQN